MMRFALVLLVVSTPAQAADIAVARFGTTTKGQPVSRITMTNDRGMRVSVLSYGATLTEIAVPDRNGRNRNVVLSLPDMPAYERSARRWGGIVGRYAGRIDGAAFRLSGTTHRLEPGRNGVTLHGGSDGYDKRPWQVTTAHDARSMAATFTLVSPDGDQGFPGRLTVQVTYRLQRAADTLVIEYRATTTAPTPFNPTNHLFLNLAGAGSGTIEGHRMRLMADRYADTDARKIPTGRLLPVAGTPLDFRVVRAIDPTRAHPLLTASNGFDHSYVVRSRPATRPLPVAILAEPVSGRRLTIASTEPALQVNSGNGFDGSETGSEGIAYPTYAGIALETQHLPDSPNRPTFPTTIVTPGRAFRSVTEYRFSADTRIVTQKM
ncbi:MAG: aldose epimerase family protein [Pseudomonadota bacterium]